MASPTLLHFGKTNKFVLLSAYAPTAIESPLDFLHKRDGVRFRNECFAQNFYTMTFDMDGDTLRIATWLHGDSEYRGNDYVLLSQSAEILTVDDDDTVPYRRNGDSIFLLERHDTVRFVYTLQAYDYRTVDGAIVLRREGNWYPHRNGELLTADISLKADGYYIVGGSEKTPSLCSTPFV